MSDITFFSEQIDFELKESNRYKDWIRTSIKAEELETGDINFIFCTDDYLLKINQDYLNHHYYTDIITFDSSDEEDIIEGDIFISIDRIKENAKDIGISFEEELKRVIIHGVLHLIGYNDKSKEEQLEMRSKETNLIKQFL